MLGVCGCGNEPSGSIKDDECIGHTRDGQRFREDCVSLVLVFYSSIILSVITPFYVALKQSLSCMNWRLFCNISIMFSDNGSYF